ncbi:MAG: carboxypeptidase-like regulatory domain-containing protein [Marinifilaceae bacterium]|nr:carboxypeptidase-like regulatory domain-containing protein [Marinifilaceae bacterium]
MKTSLLTIFLSLFFLFGAFSQKESNDDTFIVSGKVINPENMEGISFANVNLQGTNWGIVCDSAGFFRLRIHPDQKLRISALGFQEQVVGIEPPKVEQEVFQEIFMEKGSILLEEVSIYSLGTYSQFKENFIKTDAPEEENIATTFDFGNLNLAQAEANTLNRGGGGFGFGIRINGRKTKKNPRMEPLAQLHEQMLTSKFNKELVADVTKESGERLDLLVKYINSKSTFSYRTSEYYIINKVKQLYQDFLLEKPQFENNLSFTDSLGTIMNHLRP